MNRMKLRIPCNIVVCLFSTNNRFSLLPKSIVLHGELVSCWCVMCALQLAEIGGDSCINALHQPGFPLLPPHGRRKPTLRAKFTRGIDSSKSAATSPSKPTPRETNRDHDGHSPAPSHEAQLGMAEDEFAGIHARLVTLTEETLPAFEAALAEAGAPWTPGTVIPGP